jgi:hypothetical protein
VVFFGQPDAGDREWVFIDAGLPGFAGAISTRQPSDSTRTRGPLPF